MNLADQLSLENTIGRLRAVECAIQSLILTHPDPAAFGDTLHGLLRSVGARQERDGSDPHVETSVGFREAGDGFRRAAEVAVSTSQGHPFPTDGVGHTNGHGAAPGDGI